MTVFLYASSIPCDHYAHVSYPGKESLQIHSVVWKAHSMFQMVRSGTFHVKGALKKVWRHGEKMLYQGIGNVYIIQKGSVDVD